MNTLIIFKNLIEEIVGLILILIVPIERFYPYDEPKMAIFHENLSNRIVKIVKIEAFSQKLS